MKIIADTHSHTEICPHAYSTLRENAKAAKNKGLFFVCNTEHAPALYDGAPFSYFESLEEQPRYIRDVMVLQGAEVNILDASGRLDMNSSILNKLEWLIASMHLGVYMPGSKKEHTKAYLKVIQNSPIHVLGHIGTPSFPVDYEEVVKACKEYDKIIEINNSSHRTRRGSYKNCVTIADLCGVHGVPIVVSSDAHHHRAIGEFDTSMEILNKVDFPEELILNADKQRFHDRIHHINGGTLSGE